MPATPTSTTRSTRLPKISAVTAASSATGRSEVPAVMMLMKVEGMALFLSFHRNRAGNRIINGIRADLLNFLVHVFIHAGGQNIVFMGEHESNDTGHLFRVFPCPKITSGYPVRSSRWVSMVAYPRSFVPKSFSCSRACSTVQYCLPSHRKGALLRVHGS